MFSPRRGAPGSGRSRGASGVSAWLWRWSLPLGLEGPQSVCSVKLKPAAGFESLPAHYCPWFFPPASNWDPPQTTSYSLSLNVPPVRWPERVPELYTARDWHLGPRSKPSPCGQPAWPAPRAPERWGDGCARLTGGPSPAERQHPRRPEKAGSSWAKPYPRPHACPARHTPGLWPLLGCCLRDRRLNTVMKLRTNICRNSVHDQAGFQPAC